MSERERTVVITAPRTFKLPLLPNYMRQVGAGENDGIDVADLDADTLRTVGLAWADALLEHAESRRKTRGAK